MSVQTVADSMRRGDRPDTAHVVSRTRSRPPACLRCLWAVTAPRRSRTSPKARAAVPPHHDRGMGLAGRPFRPDASLLWSRRKDCTSTTTDYTPRQPSRRAAKTPAHRSRHNHCNAENNADDGTEPARRFTGSRCTRWHPSTLHEGDARPHTSGVRRHERSACGTSPTSRGSRPEDPSTTAARALPVSGRPPPFAGWPA